MTQSDIQQAAEMLRRKGLGLNFNPADNLSGIPAIARTLIEQQISAYEVMMKQAPMAAFLRQQAMMIDLALSVFKTQKAIRRKS